MLTHVQRTYAWFLVFVSVLVLLRTAYVIQVSSVSGSAPAGTHMPFSIHFISKYIRPLMPWLVLATPLVFRSWKAFLPYVASGIVAILVVVLVVQQNGNISIRELGGWPARIFALVYCVGNLVNALLWLKRYTEELTPRPISAVV